MGTPRDTRPANWEKRVRKWRRWMAELRELGQVECTEPEGFEVPPHLRIAKPSTGE